MLSPPTFTVTVRQPQALTAQVVARACDKGSSRAALLSERIGPLKVKPPGQVSLERAHLYMTLTLTSDPQDCSSSSDSLEFDSRPVSSAASCSELQVHCGK